MPDVVHNAQDMISGMTPVTKPGEFVFVSSTDPALVASLSPKAISIFQEDEGVSLLVPVELAELAGQKVDQPLCCITLNVYSSLDGVGLTAAASKALADNEIACNMIAAFNHDHVFVPSKLCDQAMEVLLSLQKQATVE